MADRVAPIPDDMADVEEISTRIEDFIFDELEDVDLRIAMSALISSSLTVLYTKCDTKDKANLYRLIFIGMLDKDLS